MDDEALFIISVAARMVGMHAQTLRKYERAGFLLPSRTDGRLRLYSRDDLRRLRQIKRLVEARELNLAGVELALGLTDELLRLLDDLDSTDDAGEMRARPGEGLADAARPRSSSRLTPEARSAR